MLEKTQAVDNDYFIAEFLLTLPIAGRYMAHVSTALIDEQGSNWNTGQQCGWRQCHVHNRMWSFHSIAELCIVVDTDEKLDHMMKELSAQKRRDRDTLSANAPGLL